MTGVRHGPTRLRGGVEQDALRDGRQDRRRRDRLDAAAGDVELR